jgi:hypothetical protein
MMYAWLSLEFVMLEVLVYTSDRVEMICLVMPFTYKIPYYVPRTWELPSDPPSIASRRSW